MHTPALFDFPLPLSIASRPVASMAETTADGAAVPSMKTNCFCKFASTLVIPEGCKRVLLNGISEAPKLPSSLFKTPETSLTHESQCSGTANVVYQLSNDQVREPVVTGLTWNASIPILPILEEGFFDSRISSKSVVAIERPQHDDTEKHKNQENTACPYSKSNLWVRKALKSSPTKLEKKAPPSSSGSSTYTFLVSFFVEEFSQDN